MRWLGQDLSVCALRDGAFMIPKSVLEASGVPAGTSGETSIFAFAINFGAEIWLVDAGAGPCLGDEGGRVLDALKEEALDPLKVSRILLTHLHPDHVGGLADEEGQPRFPGAEVVVAHREWADWLSSSARNGHDDNAAQVADWAERAMSRYSLLRVDGPTNLGRGVEVLPAPGHRPGHIAFRLGAAGAGVLFAGDVLHLPAWQLADPDRGLVWDMDAEAARATRRHLLNLAVAEDLLLAGAHLGPWGLAKIQKDGPGFRAHPPS
jgi:glyoxylase-like metal-dependent hydrolase (beta-lactamase superfamily II)